MQNGGVKELTELARVRSLIFQNQAVRPGKQTMASWLSYMFVEPAGRSG
jgi:hypothetical protein